ncbi:MAG: hypothetical protein EP329_13450 [Deltaproteobacteria bacterium]|nr:MAG: hypothetical protein EP329_13450 [Deltaproteobacteria bacterium]
MRHALPLALALLLLSSAPSLACDWPVANDVLTMADRAPRVSVVRATGPRAATVIEDLVGAGPMTVEVGDTNCDPSFEAGATYLLFHDGEGGSVSDDSGARLEGLSGERLLAAVKAWRATPEKGRDALLRALYALETQAFPNPQAVRDAKRWWELRLLHDVTRIGRNRRALPTPK